MHCVRFSLEDIHWVFKLVGGEKLNRGHPIEKGVLLLGVSSTKTLTYRQVVHIGWSGACFIAT